MERTQKPSVKLVDNDPKPKRKKKGIRIVRYMALFFLFCCVTVASFDFSFKYVIKIDRDVEKLDLISKNIKDGVEIEIPYDSNTQDIIDLLHDKELINYPFLFKLLSKINGYDGTYQAGLHVISKEMTYEEMMFVLSGKSKTVKVTIPEGYITSQIADTLAKKEVIDRNSFYEAIKAEKFNYKFLENLPERENLLEGYLFPDTYEFNAKAKPRDVLYKFLYNFNNKFEKRFYDLAEALDLTVDQVVILASIVEKESGDSHDRSIIASILYKRLKSTDASMAKLQSCATIQYIYLRDTGKVKPVLYNSDTQIQDPYNTYYVTGLPPGPICNPSLDAIKAVLHIDSNTPYWYFVARGDGSTEFSATYEQQKAAMIKYNVLVN